MQDSSHSRPQRHRLNNTRGTTPFNYDIIRGARAIRLFRQCEIDRANIKKMAAFRGKI